MDPIGSSGPTPRVTKFIFMVAGLTAIGLAAYFGIGYMKGKSKGTEATTSTTATSDTKGATDTEQVPAGTDTPTTTDKCDAVTRGNLSTNTTFQAWYSSMNTFLQTQALNLQATRADLEALVTKATEIEASRACLEQLTGDLQNSPTSLANFQATSQNLDKTIEERRRDVQIAKDRAALAVNPELTRSYYDGWFPLDRPMRPISIPVLIAFALFFFSMGAFLLMGILGVDVMMYRRSLPTPSQGSGKFGAPFWGMTGVATILLGLTIYSFTKK